jgi:hypothetical protein
MLCRSFVCQDVIVVSGRYFLERERNARHLVSLEYYVQSCGAAPDHDYRWLKMVGEQTVQADPPFVDHVIPLIQSDAFSLVLYRDANTLLLLLTGLDTSRQDYLRRSIRNSLACSASSLDDEPLLRGMAAWVLQDQEHFEQEIDKYVLEDFDNESGFRIVSNLPAVLAANMVGNDQSQAPAGEIRARIAKNTAANREALGQELATTPLPDLNGPLVIVTKNVAPETRWNEQMVWRGLSALVQKPSERLVQKPAYQQSKYWKRG